jgi:hypothetical protein
MIFCQSSRMSVIPLHRCECPTRHNSDCNDSCSRESKAAAYLRLPAKHYMLPSFREYLILTRARFYCTSPPPLIPPAMLIALWISLQYQSPCSAACCCATAEPVGRWPQWREPLPCTRTACCTPLHRCLGGCPQRPTRDWASTALLDSCRSCRSPKRRHTLWRQTNASRSAHTVTSIRRTDWQSCKSVWL